MSTLLTSYDPSTGEAVGEVPVTPVSEINAIVTASRKAQISWRQLSVDERVSLIKRASALVEQNHRQLAQLLSREMGKDLRRSTGEVLGCAQGAPYIAQQVQEAIVPKNASGATIDYAPLGVAAIISPWNYPLAMAMNLLVPALVAGNTVVFKPSEETPLVAQAYVDLLNQVLPLQVLQVVYGDKAQGQALVDSDINIVAFTGSKAAGQDIMRRAAGSLKRLIMELGGNDPMIVMSNADVNAAARFAVASSFENAGQMCTSTERIYADETIADEFEAQVTAIAQRYHVGPWHETGVNIGPIINERQRQKIIDHVDDAVSKGARILLGGKDYPDRYISPTVLADVTPDTHMEHEETFGPVVSISRYTTVDEAIRRANDSEYGLGAVVFGGQGAERVARQLEAGMIGVNGGPGSGGDTPWVGAKQSGFGFHGSAEGHRQFTQIRVIS